MFGVKNQTKDGDSRVAKAFKELNIEYQLDDDGDYRFGFDLGEGRSQMGFIRSETFEFAGVEMREIFSVGLKSFGPFDARTSNFLLEQNTRMKVGAWSTVRDAEDNHLALFGAKIAADMKGELLVGVILAVLTAADEMEHRLSGRDDF
jgi:hypothetical protein